MPTDPKVTADRLLDAGVDYIMAELSDERLADVVARDVGDVLKALDASPLEQLVDRDNVKATAYVIVDQGGGSAVVQKLVVAIGSAIYQLAANDEHKLGAVIDREQVQLLVRKILAMRTLHEEVLSRLSESPMVGNVASWFVTKLVSDVLQQNRAKAEKVPGVSTLFSIGDKAANKVRGATSRHFDEFVGDMAGKGAQLAAKRVNTAIKHTMAKAPLEDAAMEVWDRHADDTVSGLKDYLSEQDLLDIGVIGFDLWLALRNTEYVRELIGAGIDVFFDTYGSSSLSELLTELDLSADDVIAEAQRHAPGVFAALRADGRLEALVRARLEPFFHSDGVLAILAGR